MKQKNNQPAQSPYSDAEQLAYMQANALVNQFKNQETVLVEIIKNLILKAQGEQK